MVNLCQNKTYNLKWKDQVMVSLYWNNACNSWEMKQVPVSYSILTSMVYWPQGQFSSMVYWTPFTVGLYIARIRMYGPSLLIWNPVACWGYMSTAFCYHSELSVFFYNPVSWNSNYINNMPNNSKRQRCLDIVFIDTSKKYAQLQAGAILHSFKGMS